MKKTRLWGLLSVVLVLTMLVSAVAITAGADSSVISDKEMDALLNTTTDPEQNASPFTKVAKQVRNSVVGINNYQMSISYYGFGFGSEPQATERLVGTGSGVAITKYGHVLTNYHVVQDANRLSVTVADEDKEYAAAVVGFDADKDIAILQVDGLKVAPVELGDSDQMQVGEWAVVIGNPLGEKFARTVTVGVVSALDRELQDTNYDRFGRRYTTTNTMIQVDAAINQGNSGGGMFNLQGQLQGIPARKFSSNSMYSPTTVDNIGMCIPINVAKPLIEEVLKNYDGTSPIQNAGQQSKNNDVMLSKPRLGVSVYSLSSAVTEKLPIGSLVNEVEKHSPAEEAGIKVGDIIVAIDDEVCSSSNALREKLQDYKEGDEIIVKVYRAAGMENFAKEQNLEKIGEGEYLDLHVILRVVGNVAS